MAFIEHLHGTGAASSSEKISALQRQLEDLRSENERLVSENKSLEEINALERQVKDLRSENECLASHNESLRAKSTAHSAEEESSPDTATCKEGSDYLAQELNRVHDVASELGLTLLNPINHNELSVLCSLICHERKLANLKSFLQDYSGVLDMTGGSICLEGTGMRFLTLQPFIIVKNRTRCRAHDTNNDCVWISKRGSGWIIGSGQV